MRNFFINQNLIEMHLNDLIVSSFPQSLVSHSRVGNMHYGGRAEDK